MEKKLTFSIDRLTIIGSFLHNSSFYDCYDYLNNLDTESCYEVKNNENGIFMFSYHIVGLGFIQIDKPTNKIRIDFNPNKITIYGKAILNDLLSYTKTIHYSRLDLAIDLYNYDIITPYIIVV